MATIAENLAGKAAQYELAGTTTSTTIGPYDSGNILGTVPPGKPGIKLVDGTIQKSTVLTSTPAGTDPQNFLSCTSQPQASGDPTVNSAQVESNGMSMAPQTE